MAFDFRNTLVGHAFPENLSGGLIDRVDLPAMLGIVFDWSNVAEESVTRFVFTTANSGSNENLVAPNYRARVGQTGNLEFPAHALRLRDVPLHWLSRTFNDAARAWTTKLRPVLC